MAFQIELDRTEQGVLNIIRTNPGLTTAGLTDKTKTGLTTSKLTPVLKLLQRLNKIEKKLADKGRQVWYFNEKAEVEEEQALAAARTTSAGTKVNREVQGKCYTYFVHYSFYKDNQGLGEANNEMDFDRKLSGIKDIRGIESKLTQFHAEKDRKVNRVVVRDFKLLRITAQYKPTEK